MKRTVAPTPHLRRAGSVIAASNLVVIALATLLPEPGVGIGSHLCLVCGPLGGVNSLLNIFLFVPLGLGLAIAGVRANRALPAMCSLSALIEIAQLLLIPGRYATIGDVLTNSLGGALGFVIGRNAFTLLRPSPRIALALTMVWSATWLAIQTTSAYGFSLVMPSSRYYGEIAPSLENFGQFRGRVLHASVGDVEVPDGQFTDSRRVRDLLLSGATVTTSIVAPPSASEIAAIVRVVDGGQREILLLAQSAGDLVFGVRTGAVVLRLRPPLFALSDALPRVSRDDAGVTRDAVIVSASYSARELWLNARSMTSDDRRIPISASLGWTMLLPSQWFIEGTPIELAVSFVWIACLLLPLGYWGGRIAKGPGTREATRVWIIAVPIGLLLLYVGLVVAPQRFGLPAAPRRDWLAALIGILAGAALTPRTSEPNREVVKTDQ